MKPSRPAPLEAHHGLADFDCGQGALDTWLKRNALQAQAAGSARTFVAADGARVVAYYSLTVGQIEQLEATPRVRKGMGRFPIPIVLLARLAVTRQAQGLGIGRGLLQDAVLRTLNISEQAGVRALLTHPIDAAADRFYRRFGFEPSPLGDDRLLLLLKDAKMTLGSD